MKRAAPAREPSTRFRFAGREFLVVRLDGDAPPALAKVPPAEREVALGLLRGRSNAEIARARGTSSRTVAKQVASLFRRLGVGSRAELVSHLSAPPAGAERPPPPRRR